MKDTPQLWKAQYSLECRSQTGADFNEDWYMALTVAKMGSQVFWDTILS
jgi:hypothetical protein